MANLEAVKQALEAVRAAVEEADGGDLAMRGKPQHAEPDGDEMGAPTDAPCPECEAGTCEKPEHHMDEMYGQEG